MIEWDDFMSKWIVAWVIFLSLVVGIMLVGILSIGILLLDKSI